MNTKKLVIAIVLVMFSTFYTYNYGQIISTIAGNGAVGYSGAGGPATAAELNEPDGMCADASGNIYSAEAGSDNITMVNTTSGIIYSIAGKPGNYGYSGDGGQATNALLNTPIDVKMDVFGNLFISDRTNYIIRKINTSGVITTIAGTPGSAGYSGDGGQATSARLNNPAGIFVTATGDLLIGDYTNNVIREVNTSGIISTIAGTGTAGFGGDGGLATKAALSSPVGVSTDLNGNIYVCDRNNNRIRIINTSGIISTFAGNGTAGYSGDGGQATAAEINGPTFVFADPTGNLYFSNINNGCIRKINSSGIISTVAGNGFPGFSGDGGLATAAELNDPAGVTLDRSDNLFIGDLTNNRIRKVNYCNFSSAITTLQNVLCNGQNEGSVTVNIIGGTAPYTYFWTSGEGTNSNINDLSAGSYTVYVSDNHGCTSNASVTITQPSILTISATTLSNEICNGDSNGKASCIITGGSLPYTYLWTPRGGTNSTASTLIAGIYTVKITDHNGCKDSAIVIITQPPSKSISFLNANIGCFGGNDGASTIFISGGGAPYTYLWSNGNTTSSINHLTAGIYTVTIIDANSCRITLADTIQQPPFLSVVLIPSNLKCYGANNGYITSTISGGTLPYQYKWSPGGGTNTSDSSLKAGYYTLTVTDNNGCIGFATIAITEPAKLIDSIPSGMICKRDTITLYDYSFGGTPPYHYLWSTSSSSTFISVAPNSDFTYFVSVTDHNGCISRDSVMVQVNPPPTVIVVHRSNDSVCSSQGRISIFTYPSGGSLTGGGIYGGYFYPDSAISNGFNLIYYTYIDSNGCSGHASDSIYVETCTGLNEISLNSNSIKVFPNPTSGIFTITRSNADASRTTLEIYNVMGQRVKSEELRVKSVEIDLSSNPDGIYFYRVIDENGNVIGSGKVVIEK